MVKYNKVLIYSFLITSLFVIIGILFTETLYGIASNILNYLLVNFGWFYLLTGFIVFGALFLLAVSKFGNIKLGKETDQPEYSTFAWIAMLFSAGMGVGLVFWGVAEPVSFYHSPPYGEANTDEAAMVGMKHVFFHWGLHPWSIYGIIGLALAYFQYRKGLPTLISSAFYPLLGDRIYGPAGRAIDILSIFITAIGVASTFGLSTLQIAEGLNIVYGIPDTLVTQIGIIIVGTAMFVISAATGIRKGIRILSNINIFLMLIVMLYILIVGPTNKIFSIFFATIGAYLNDILNMSLRLAPFNENNNAWITGWTVFYWAWWTTWAPFVGTFIARISKGRTIREFVFGVLCVPALLSFLWFAVMGGSALHLIHDLGESALLEAINSNLEAALFLFFDYFPLSSLIISITMILLLVFFVTSGDSATVVLGMFSGNGNLNPSITIRAMWGIIIMLAAVVFLLSGGLEAVKTFSIVVASPFIVIMIIMTYSLYKDLSREGKHVVESPKVEKEPIDRTTISATN